MDTSFTVIKTPECLGIQEEKKWIVEDYILDQGIKVYERYESLYQEITDHERAKSADITNPEVFRMIYMALYDLDKFREFVFDSNFLNYFEVEQGRIDTIRNDDIELLVFGFDWIKFGLLAADVYGKGRSGQRKA